MHGAAHGHNLKTSKVHMYHLKKKSSRFISVYLIYQVASGHGNVKNKIVYLPLMSTSLAGDKTDVKKGHGIEETFFHGKMYRDNFPFLGHLWCFITSKEILESGLEIAPTLHCRLSKYGALLCTTVN